MKAFKDGTIDYKAMSDRCVKKWERQANPEIIAKQHLDLYEELLKLYIKKGLLMEADWAKNQIKDHNELLDGAKN